MEKIKHKNWTHKNGYLPVSWKPEDYLTVPYTRRDHDHGQTNLGFSTAKANYDLYKENVSVHVPVDGYELPKLFWDICDNFDLKEMAVSLSMYTPGMLLPWHTDDFPTYARNKKVQDKEKIVRIIVFLHDQKPGHQLWIEDKCYFGDSGFYVAWTGTTKHMAANIGEEDRYVLQITGINE
jgi:hypothetical protein